MPSTLLDRAVRPGETGYARYTSSYLRGGAPGLVLRPTTAGEVQEAVRLATHHRDVPLGIFSAGHGLSGRSLNVGGLVIDVGAINHVETLGGQRVRVGPGARWLDVARRLTPLGLAISSGDYGGVGVGGLATAGGIGLLAREHGLTIDHLRAVDLVAASGELVHASDDENPELFWAMRGAGANFGVAVSFEFEAARVGQVTLAQLTFATDDIASFLERWGDAMEAADRSLTGVVLLGPGRRGQLSFAQAMVVVNSDDLAVAIERLQPIAQAAKVADQLVRLTTYDAVMAAYVDENVPQQGQGEPLSHSGLVKHLDSAFAAEAAALLDAGAAHFFSVRAVGGAVADVAADATAYGWRQANFSVSAIGSPGSGLDEWWTKLLPHFEGMYLSFETDTGPDVVARAYPPAHLTRLRQLKRRYDPTGLFRDNFFIDPAIT